MGAFSEFSAPLDAEGVPCGLCPSCNRGEFWRWPKYHKDHNPAGFAGSARHLPMEAVHAISAGCPTRCFSGWLFFLFPMGLLRDGTNVIILATKPRKRCVKHASATPRSRADHIAYLVRSPGRANSRHRLWAVLGYSRERALRFWLGASGSLRLGCLHSKL